MRACVRVCVCVCVVCMHTSMQTPPRNCACLRQGRLMMNRRGAGSRARVGVGVGVGAGGSGGRGRGVRDGAVRHVQRSQRLGLGGIYTQ